MKRAGHLVRPLVRKLQAYIPGEQPRIRGLIKLNTNENPYPPSPRVLKALGGALDGRLRLYPNPTAQNLREALARCHGCEPRNVIVGNGSDELLALAVRAFVEPKSDEAARGEMGGRRDSRFVVQYFTPSYSLYPVLAATHGARALGVPLGGDFALPGPSVMRNHWDRDAALTFVTTPNAPSGRGYRTTELERLCERQRGVIILDEAYADFAAENALALGLKLPHVLVARTFSKGYSLCFQRVGYFIGNPELIAALDKIRDSYNVNGLGQIAAEATLEDRGYYEANFKKVIATRERTAKELERAGFQVYPSQANFLFVRPPILEAKEWLEELRKRKILVRWFSSEECRAFLRITIGTDEQMDQLLAATRRILARV